MGAGVIAGLVFGEINEGFRCESPNLTNSMAYLTYGDKSSLYLQSVKNPKYANHILDWDLKNKINADIFEVLDYIQYGKLMNSVLQDEIAYQCFYMAHLKDHRQIGANSEFQL
jgi:hypothetical protein